jgi:hypothetical protein
MEAFHNSINSNANFLATTGLKSATGAISSSSSSAIVDAIFSGSMQITSAAVTAKASAQSAQQSALNSVTSSVTSAMQDYTMAKSSYDIAKENLASLESKKSSGTDENISTIQSKIDALKSNYVEGDNNSGNASVSNQIDTLNANIASMKKAQNEIASLDQTISANKALADSSNIGGNIGDSGVSVTYDGSASDTNRAVNLINQNNTAGNARYYKPDSKDNTKTIFMQNLFNMDLASAQQMDSKQAAINKARENVKAAESQKSKIQLPEGVTPENVSTQLSLSETKLAELNTQQMNGVDGNSMSYADYKNEMSKLESELESAKQSKDDKTLDSQIATANTDVKNKENVLNAKKKNLQQVRSKLEAQINQMNSLTNSTTVNSAEEQYNAAKSQNNKDRNFFQKLFGTGKSKDVKNSKLAYKQAQAAQKQNLQAFATQTGYSANASNITYLQNQIASIDEMLKQ